MTDRTGQSTGNGGLTVTLDTTAFPVSHGQLSGANFRIDDQGRNFSWLTLAATAALDDSMTPGDYSEDISGSLTGSTFSGKINVDTVTALRGTSGEPPSSGELLFTGANGATVRLTVVDNANVSLQIDINGDGVVDETQDTTWAALNL